MDDRSHLLTVPQEILQQIARNLKTPDYGNLRRTCKHVEASLFSGFAREFFHKKQFMLTRFSLQALVDISNSRLAQCLTHVIFSVERPSTRDASNTPSPVWVQTDIPKRNRFREEYVDFLSLTESGHDFEMMAEAFRNLPNLSTVEIRDFNSRSRFRDEPDISWNSYGAPTYLRETGYKLEIMNMFSGLSDDQGLYTSRLFRGLLRALGNTPTRPTRLEVNLRRSQALRDHAFNIPVYQEAAILPVLGSLKDLYIDVHSSFFPTIVNPKFEACHTYLLRLFMARVGQLEHLRLNFSSCDPSHIRDFMSWFSITAFPDAPAVGPLPLPTGPLPGSPPPVNFTNLRQLDIGKVVVEPKILLAVLQKYRATLHGIDFHRVELLDSKSSERTSQWSKFFERMSKLNLQLNRVSMSSLGQVKENRRGKRTITFRDCKNKYQRTWEGQDLPGALKDFKENVVVDWPERDTSTDDTLNSGSDSEEEEDDEDEEEDDE